MKKTVFFLLATTLLVSAVLTRAEAAMTWTGNCHEYEIVLAPGITWGDAIKDVQDRLGEGWYLATITSKQENDWVYENLVAPVVYPPSTDPNVPQTLNREWWLGGYQYTGDSSDQKKNWRWVTGENWNYTNWNSIEPSGGEYFLGMWGSQSGDYSGVGGYWNDEGWLDNINGYIAEKGTPGSKGGKCR